jgi:hypothetical protein
MAARDWEQSFTSWAKPPGKSEQEKCENAERAIHNAIDASNALRQCRVDVFTQGSYRNRTNNRVESDVDIAVRSGTAAFFFAIPRGTQRGSFGIGPAAYSYGDFKNAVGAALSAYLGGDAVRRGENAFDIHANSYRVDADALACFEYRVYRSDGNVVSGTAFVPDGGQRLIVNWPLQNYVNGGRKHEATGQRFKKVVRILKALRSEMEEAGVEVAAKIPSYLIECLAWNVPNEGFGYDTLLGDVCFSLYFLKSTTVAGGIAANWFEINNIKPLFAPGQPWTQHDANLFLELAWYYADFNEQ